ncbi:glycosyltransferase 87 family protein [Terrabacter sp. LjRoot27]|uniref:glycosyltransferase 87 family protein n=1 Tax=Terrabacter sp. LjRoot27 TaxID=3342306 RepID=UPI003ECE2730
MAGTSIDRERLLRALWVALLPGGLLFAYLQVSGYVRAGTLGLDSHAYWLAASDPSSWYTLPPEFTDAYLYSPVFAQVLTPLGHLPWPVFQVLWAMLGVAALFWLVSPLGWLRGVVSGLFLLPDILIGNIYLFFAVALVWSVRGRAWWLMLPLLTKIGPAVVGLWFPVRRDWRPVVWAVASTVVVCGLSYAVSPDAWARWVSFVLESAGDRGLGPTVRLGCAALLTVWAALGGRAWLLAPAMVLGCPVIEGYAVFAILAAIPRLFAWQRTHERSGADGLRTPRHEGRGRVEDVDVADPEPLAP